ncbi:MAG TPA: hypothetical protein VG056_14850, partial [Pirellulales bacterium]|nr:hypothetical protein [Pirellulales bacterium]
MKPVLQALLVADNVYTDQTTGKKVVAGIFNKLTFQSPVQPGVPIPETPSGQPTYIAGSPMAYISLTEVREATELVLRYVDLEDNSILFS